MEQVREKDSMPPIPVLPHSGGDITDHYIRDSALGELQLAAGSVMSTNSG